MWWFFQGEYWMSCITASPILQTCCECCIVCGDGSLHFSELFCCWRHPAVWMHDRPFKGRLDIFKDLPSLSRRPKGINTSPYGICVLCVHCLQEMLWSLTLWRLDFKDSPLEVLLIFLLMEKYGKMFLFFNVFPCLVERWFCWNKTAPWKEECCVVILFPWISSLLAIQFADYDYSPWTSMNHPPGISWLGYWPEVLIIEHAWHSTILSILISIIFTNW